MEGYLNRQTATASPKGRLRVRKPAPEVRCIDLFVYLRVMLLDYREEQAQR
jgi:hypothetical protein